MDTTSYLLGKKHGGVQPTGEIDITANGVYNVGGYATADVQVPQPSGSVSITENGTYDVTNYASANVSVGGTPTTMNELVTSLNSIVSLYKSTFEHSIFDSTSPITLYTPDVNYKKYFIIKRSGKFHVFWINGDYFFYQDGQVYPKQINTYNGYTPTTMIITMNTSQVGTRIYDATFDTYQECINAIQSNQTTYTSTSLANWSLQSHNGRDVINTNGYVWDYEGKYLNEKSIPLSSNETIEVISS